jgi:uncharacterized membrane-anchored protein YhcB (DUF1043 family)
MARKKKNPVSVWAILRIALRLAPLVGMVVERLMSASYNKSQALEIAVGAVETALESLVE